MQSRNAKMANPKSQIRLGAKMSYISIFFNIIAGLVYTPWMVSEIGQSDYGLYTLAISLIGFFAMDFGLGSAVAKFISEYKAKNDQEAIKNFLGIVYKLFCILTIVLLVAFIFVFFFIDDIYVKLSLTEIERFKIVFVISGIFTVFSFPFRPLDGILIANEEFAILQFVNLIQKILTVILMVICLLLGFKLYALVIVNAFVGVIKEGIKYYAVKSKSDFEVNWKYGNVLLLKEVAGFSIWTTVIAIAQRFILTITLSVLGALSGSVQISIFAIGMVIEGYTWTISNAMGGLFLPKISKMLISENGISDIENLFIKVGRIQLAIIGLIIVGFSIIGKDFMLLWMGSDFKDSYYVALLLIGPGIVTFTQQIGSTTLIASNKIKIMARGYCITAGVSFFLSLILSFYYGAMGAALAIFIGNIMGHIIYMSYIYNKHIGIDIVKVYRNCHFKFLVPIVLTYLAGVLIQYIVKDNSVLIFGLKGVSILVAYIGFMWFFAFNKYEKNSILELFRLNLIK